MQTYVSTAQPGGVAVGDMWFHPATRALKICIQTDPSVQFSSVAAVPGQTPTTVASVAGTIPAGGTGAAAGGWDTSGNRDTAITTIGEIKTQLNAALAALRAAGIIA